MQIYSYMITIYFIYNRVLSCVANYFENAISMDEIVGDDIYFEIIYPKELAYTYKIRPAQNFGTPFNDSHSLKKIRLVLTDPPEACHHIKNADEINGNVAFVERGECNFLHKTITIEQAGGVAIIVSDNNQNNDDLYIEMIDDNSNREVSIPAGFLLGKNGYVIKTTLKKLKRKYALINLPVNLTSKAIGDFNQPPWVTCSWFLSFRVR